MAKVWTVGYEGQSPEDLVRLLQAAGVQRVVDVRKLPLSRKKGFSKRGLEATLGEAGIGYTHKPELGVTKEVRDAYHRSGDLGALATWYDAHLAGQGASLAGLLQMIEQERVALLCFEQDHAACHRGLLAKRVASAGVEAQHL